MFLFFKRSWAAKWNENFYLRLFKERFKISFFIALHWINSTYTQYVNYIKGNHAYTHSCTLSSPRIIKNNDSVCVCSSSSSSSSFVRSMSFYNIQLAGKQWYYYHHRHHHNNYLPLLPVLLMLFPIILRAHSSSTSKYIYFHICST